MVDRHLLIALYVMALPVLVSALEPFANVTSDRPGVIQGTVTSRAGGSAVPNAEVIALSEHTFTTRTDTSGMFSFVNLPLGTYEVTVIPEWHEWWFGTCIVTRAALTGIQEIAVADAVGTLYGTIESAGHKSGHSAAEVTFGGPTAGTARVTGYGVYTVTDLPCGLYTLYVGARAHQPQQLAGVNVRSRRVTTNTFKLGIIDSKLLKELVDMADEAEYQGDYPTAIATYGKIIDLQPCALAYANRGTLNLKAGNYTNAIYDFTQALGWKPGMASVELDLAEAYEFAGEYEQARKLLSSLLARTPTDANLYRRRARIALHQGLTNDVLADLEQCLRHADDQAEAHYQRARIFYRMGWLGKTEEEIQQALAVQPNDPDYRYFQAQTVFYTKGDSAAYESVMYVLEADRGHVPGNTLLGILHSNRKNWPAAERAFTLALRRDPTFVDALIGRGKARVELGRLEQACDDYSLALRHDPQSLLALLGRSLALIKLERYQEALPDLNRVLELRPGDPIALFNRALVYDQLGEEELARKDRLQRTLSIQARGRR